MLLTCVVPGADPRGGSRGWNPPLEKKKKKEKKKRKRRKKRKKERGGKKEKINKTIFWNYELISIYFPLVLGISSILAIQT